MRIRIQLLISMRIRIQLLFKCWSGSSFQNLPIQIYLNFVKIKFIPNFLAFLLLFFNFSLLQYIRIRIQNADQDQEGNECRCRSTALLFLSLDVYRYSLSARNFFFFTFSLQSTNIFNNLNYFRSCSTYLFGKLTRVTSSQSVKEWLVLFGRMTHWTGA